MIRTLSAAALVISIAAVPTVVPAYSTEYEGTLETAQPAIVAPAPVPAPRESSAPVAVSTPPATVVPDPGPATVPISEPPAAAAQPEPVARPRDAAGYTYTYVVDDQRLKNTVAALETYKPFGNPNSRFRPFVGGSITRDTSTTPGSSLNGGPPVPLIESDNYAVLGVGVQYTTPTGFRAFVQGGFSTQVGPVAATPSGGDLRGGVQLYREWGKTYDHAMTYGNFYGSGTYLSRYQDTVLYNQLEIAHNLGSSSHPLEPFVRATLAADTRVFYYSNTAQVTLGLRYHPLGRSGPIVSLEGSGVNYLRGTLPASEHRAYTALRPTISYGFSL